MGGRTVPTERETLVTILLIFGNLFLFIPIIIGFILWNYDMTAFRISILGLGMRIVYEHIKDNK